MSLIIEGMDGTGKTSLVNHLAQLFNLQIHERAVKSSKLGVVDNVYEWVLKDLATEPERPMVYDRHPLISEYIYSSVLRPGKIDPRFYSEEARRMLLRMSRNRLIIFCIPPAGNTLANVRHSEGNQLTGVIEHCQTLYDLYQQAYTYWPTPLNAIKFDYTNPSDLIVAETTIEYYMRNYV
jgi:hypothetical protein